jgi:hypothetical protein
MGEWKDYLSISVATIFSLIFRPIGMMRRGVPPANHRGRGGPRCSWLRGRWSGRRFAAWLPAHCAALAETNDEVATVTHREQGDLFSVRAESRDDRAADAREPRRVDSGALDDEALVEAIRWASLRDCGALVAEVVRRRFVPAIPALEALCRRFKGFGLACEIREQVVALEGLVAIGGIGAREAVARIVVGQVVQGPGLRHAVEAAVRLGVSLPNGTALLLLQHAWPEVRAGACRCVRRSPEVIAVLVELLGDLNGAVATEAACALGRMGRVESRGALARLLREKPTIGVIGAVCEVADEECLVHLGRIARGATDLAEAALAALDSIEEPRAAEIAAAARRLRAG